jgi:hypothetical protein
MKRFCFLAVLVVLSSSAHAGGSISFTVGGHRVQIESSRYCRSTSCASVSISGVSRKHDRQDNDRDAVAPVNSAPPTSQTVLPPPAVAPPVQTIIAPPPPTVHKPAASTTQVVAAPPPPQPVAIPLPPPLLPPPVEKPVETARPAPQISNVSHQVEEEPSDSPIGDWERFGLRNAAARCVATCSLQRPTTRARRSWST